MRRASLTTLALSPLVLGATSCVVPREDTGVACTKIGYDNGLAVRVNVPPDTALYRTEIEAEGDKLSLEFQVENGVSSCTGECMSEGDRIALRPRWGGPAESFVTLVQRIGDDHGPRQLAVRVYRNAALVAAESFTPQYQIDEPNGPGCGLHVFASVDIHLPGFDRVR